MATYSRHASRRRHPAELRDKVLAACEEPGASVAAVAQSHGLNANLVHNGVHLISVNWLRVSEASEFVWKAQPRWVWARLTEAGRIRSLWRSKWREARNGKAYRRV